MPSRNDEIEVLIVAAEASSALYAQRLLEYWKTHHINVKAFGVGNYEMEKLGFERYGRSEDLAIVGITEVIKHFRKIKNVFDDLVAAAETRQPRVVLLLDYPDFNLRLAKKIKKMGLPVVYYISPQIWAWRKSRIEIIKEYIDKMLVLLPFEKDFYSSHNVQVEFVGHPLLDEMNEQLFNATQRSVARKRYGITDTDILIGLMPGSRHSELKHHFMIQLKVAEKIYETHKNVKFAIFVAPSFSIDELKHFLPVMNLPLQIIRDEPMRMVNLADIVLCASGTATLIVGLLKKPMVIMYKMNPFSAFLAKFFVKGTPHFGLINLILGQRVVPEFFQSEANVDRLSSEIINYLDNPKLRESTIARLSEAHKVLGEKGATIRVAQLLAPYLKS